MSTQEERPIYECVKSTSGSWAGRKSIVDRINVFPDDLNRLMSPRPFYGDGSESDTPSKGVEAEDMFNQ